MTFSTFFRRLHLAAVCSLVFSCQSLPEEDLLPADGRSLKVEARSAGSAEILYPLYLYAFNEKGTCAASQVISEAGESMELTLPAGNYQMVALAGMSDSYQIPDNPSLDDAITLASGATTPLMIGKADVTVDSSGEESLVISLSYAVAALNVALKNIPSDVAAVSFSLSPLYSAWSFGGGYGGSSMKVEAGCSLDTENVWSSRTLYMFPGKEAETSFSIVLETKDGSRNTYGYTYAGTPEAGRPFNVGGNYSGGVTVGGSFIGGDWGTAIEVEFDFGAIQQAGDEEDPEEPDIDLSGLPEIGSIWQGAIVADMGEADASGADLLLLTLDEWEATTSQVEDLMAGYSVNGISGWRLPTYEEAQLLRSSYSGDNRTALNERIAAYDSSLYGLDGEERYLCDKAGVYYSYIYKGGTTISKAGTKRTYYVRLVKNHHIDL